MIRAGAVLQLRDDLDVIRGEPGDDGAPTMILHDAFSGGFDLVEWPETEIVARLRRPTSLERLEAGLAGETTVRASRGDLARYVADLDRRGLLASSRFRDPKELLALREREAGGLWARLLSGLLFFRVPLLKPNAFLRATARLPRILSSAPFRLVFWAALLAAAFMFPPRFGEYLASATPFVTWSGAAWLGLALVVLKAVHEFSHAYAASSRGAKVRSMGVAFMVFAPIPYTDVTDSWRLPRRDRLAVSFAGVRAELTVGVFSLLLWCLLPPGIGRDVALFLSSASIAATLLANLNPGMRFDGYYLLSDLLAVDNLQRRSAAAAWRFIAGGLLGLDVGGDGERALPRWKRLVLAAYAIYAYLYRLGVYFGIALLVYNFFPKAVGVALFAAEIWVFIVRPVFHRMREVGRMAWKGGVGIRFAAFIALAGLGAYWFAAPLPRRLAIPATVANPEARTVYALNSGTVKHNRLERGRSFESGEILVELDAPELDLAIRGAELELAAANLALENILAGGDRQRLRDRAREARRLESALAALLAQRARNVLAAGEAGRAIDADRSLTPGTHVMKGTAFGRILESGARTLIVGYLPEGSVNDVAVGGEAWFAPASDPGERLPVAIARIGEVNARRIDEEELTAPRGGGIVMVAGGDGRPEPAETVYKIEAAITGEGRPLRLGQVGRLYARTPPRSYADDTVRWLRGALLRESGF